jgi:hypothetical protein
VATRGSGGADLIPTLFSLADISRCASGWMVTRYRPVIRAAARRSGACGARINTLVVAIASTSLSGIDDYIVQSKAHCIAEAIVLNQQWYANLLL